MLEEIESSEIETMDFDEEEPKEDKKEEEEVEEEAESKPTALEDLENHRVQLVDVLRTLVNCQTQNFEKDGTEKIQIFAFQAKDYYKKLRKSMEQVDQNDKLFDLLNTLELNTSAIRFLPKHLQGHVKRKNFSGIAKILTSMKFPLSHLLKFPRALAKLNAPEESEDEEEEEAPDFPMNEGQQAVFDKIMDHIENKKEGPALKLFLSGTAGSGKSFMLKKTRDKLRKRYGPGSVVICGTTGVASVAIEGKTVHSAFMLPIDPKRPTKPKIYIPRARFYDVDEVPLLKLHNTFGRARLIVIDEISMLNNEQLYMIDVRLRQVGKEDEEFGGFNLLLMGDLLQLPPVNGDFIFTEIAQEHRPDWFQSDKNLWRKFQYMELTQNCRVLTGPQSHFAVMLSEIRLGNLSPEVIKFVDRIETTEDASDAERELLEENPGKTFIVLCATNTEVIEVNKKKMESLPNRTTFSAQYSEHSPNVPIPRDKNMLDHSVEVAPTARVMLLHNLSVSDGLVNGSIGTVMKVRKDEIVVKFDSGNEEEPTKIKRITISYEIAGETVYKTQFPLRLAYACTVHKAQGLTFDGVIMNVSRIFASGQFFVMLSRARDIELCRIIGKWPMRKEANWTAGAEVNRLRKTARLPWHCINLGRPSKKTL